MIETRDYQVNAVTNARKYNWQGLLEMATGTGKTFTSLMIANDFFDIKGKIFNIILVPYVHLMEQWEKSVEFFDFEKILVVSGGYKINNEKIKLVMRDFYRGFSKKVSLIISYNSFLNEEFQKNLKVLQKDLFLIADECHNFGTKQYIERNFEYIPYRLGLSATPIRKYDDFGSSYINTFFKNQILTFSLDEAIERNYLTPYKYKTIDTYLTFDEEEEYIRLSEIIRKLQFAVENGAADPDDLKSFLIARSNIVKRASNKITSLINHLKHRDLKNLQHILIYCAPGTIDEVTREVANLGLHVHRFDHRVNQKDRQIILKSFDEEHLQVLLAMHCLDEGVDVPATREAYFLASTTNEREFIQRRGRVLRNAKGKDFATIYDFIIQPQDITLPGMKSLKENELKRIKEFAFSALNDIEVRKKYNF